jgi:hypothetical protein
MTLVTDSPVSSGKPGEYASQSQVPGVQITLLSRDQAPQLYRILVPSD